MAVPFSDSDHSTVPAAGLRWRLSLLMFLLYATPGCFIPMLSLWLEHDLEFLPREVGRACAASSLASLIGPLIAGQVADRWLPAQYCLAGCTGCGAVLLWLLAEQADYLAVFGLSLAYWLLMAPAITLGTSLCFRHLPLPENDFGRIRLWGTVGWVVPIWLLSFWLANPPWVASLLSGLRPDDPQARLADMFRLSAILSALLAVYSLTLPHTPPLHSGGTWLAPLAAIRLLRRRSFAIYVASTFGLCVTIPFSSQGTPLLLQHLDIPLPWLTRTLTIAQSMEIVALAVLPIMLLRLGTRGTMRLGLISWTVALTLLVIGEPLLLVAGSMMLNGLCVCCFLVAGQVYVNRQAHGDIRASAQGLLTLTNGLGLLIGNELVGQVRYLVGRQFPATFGVGAAIALCLFGLFYFGFPSEESPADPAADSDGQTRGQAASDGNSPGR